MMWIQGGFLVLGGLFFIVGSLGLLRFPDTATRIHALTKVDNLGLGLLVFGLLLGAASWWLVFKLLLIWILALTASALAGHLVLQQLHPAEQPRLTHMPSLEEKQDA